MVMLIIGLMASLVAVSVGDGNRMLNFRGKARELHKLFETAVEEAIFTRQQLGFAFTPVFESDSYQLEYLAYDYKKQIWQPLVHDELGQFEFLSDTQMSLEIDDEPVILGNQDEDKAIFAIDQDLDEDQQIRPDVYVLSNGELPNFRLIFWPKEQPESQFELTGNILGQLRLKVAGEATDE